MNDFFKKLFRFFTSIDLKDIIYCLIIVLLIGALSISVSKCQNVRREYKNNIEALTDSIRYLRDKNGNLVATKLAFESDIKTLKILNEDLYKEIEDLRIKNSVNNVTCFEGVIENPEQDTAYIVLHDTIDRGFTKDFAFNNEYRTLEGNVNYQEDTLNVKIEKDEVKFDYTVAMDEDNNIYIKSSNPYVKYNMITGYKVPRPKKKHWFIGPSVNIGYGATLHNGKVLGGPNVSVGISAGYSLFSW